MIPREPWPSGLFPFFCYPMNSGRIRFFTKRRFSPLTLTLRQPL